MNSLLFGKEEVNTLKNIKIYVKIFQKNKSLINKRSLLLFIAGGFFF
ncbi:protein of unknown function [Ruminococcaceae bacterium BL-4]|nr:protein of unknown function [Ruminococcaceae bacterium BL-4]